MHVAWDQIQTVEALVRAGTLEGAAKELGLRHTTIARRMEALERSLDTPLFVRGARWIPTDLARALAERAAPMHRSAAEVEALIERAHHGRSERLTITTNDVLAPLLLRALAKIDTARTIDLHVADAVDPLERGTVDLALRPSQEPLGSLRGRRLGRLRLAVVRARGGRDRWIEPSASLRARTSMPWWRHVPEGAGALTCDTLLAMRDAVAAGLGRALIPELLARGLPVERTLDEGPPVWLLAPATRRGASEARRVATELARTLRGLEGVWV